MYKLKENAPTGECYRNATMQSELDDIVVHGNPRQITKKTFAGGHIKIVK